MNRKYIIAAVAAAMSIQTNATETTEKTETAVTETKKELKLGDVMSKPKLSGYFIGNYISGRQQQQHFQHTPYSSDDDRQNTKRL